jgi:predicted HAD superfamily Cof-like phosphohydrolase
MSSHQQQAVEFRLAMGQPLNLFSREVLKLQKTLVSEEYQELFQALYIAGDNLTNKRAREEALKELADLVYVCYQLAAAVGWDLDEALDRVQESNMSKLVDGKPLRREDGKVLKGPNYQPPTLIDLV